MATFLVMERREAGEDDVEAIRDGFSALAFLFPFIWLLWHRMWIETVVYVGLALALMGLGWLFGLGDASGFLALALNIFVGLEARNLLQATMRRRGWSDWGAVEASDAHEALMRYLAEAGHLDADSVAQPSLPMRYTGSGGPALGLFAYPDRR